MLSRYALFAVLSVALPTAWYVASRAWFESGSGLVQSVMAPRSALIFWFPLLSIATAWWFIFPKPRIEKLKLLALVVALPLGLVLGMYFGLAFTCSYMNKCM